jgi:hypothetical protein
MTQKMLKPTTVSVAPFFKLRRRAARMGNANVAMMMDMRRSFFIAASTRAITVSDSEES